MLYIDLAIFKVLIDYMTEHNVLTHSCYCSQATGSEGQIVDNITSVSPYTIRNLQPNTTYKVQVLVQVSWETYTCVADGSRRGRVHTTTFSTCTQGELLTYRQ